MRYITITYTFQQAVGNFLGAVLTRVRQNNNKFLAAVTRDKIIGSRYGVFQSFCDAFQAVTTLAVPIGIAILLEVIDIDQQQTEYSL